MSMNLLRPESVKEIEPAEYAENTEKSGNTIGVSVISIFTMNRHAEENLNPCALCGRKFISRNHSKVHNKINTWKNPYHCTMCGKGLISRNHTKSLARENLYQCILCGNIIVQTSKVQKIIV